MQSKILPQASFVALAFLVSLSVACTGCQTTAGSSFGAAIGIGQPSRTAAAAPPPPPPPPRNAGQEQAGRNSLRNAYKFLEKGMPDHARKELMKAQERLGRDFWYNYYMAGALQMEQKPTEANDYFEMALRYSPSDGLRSRVRVCQSFLYFAMDQDSKSGQMLDLAIQLDSGNRAAVSLRDDLVAGQSDQGEDDGENGKGKKGKKDKEKDKGKGKGKGKSKKLGSKDEFVSYFLVQMPD